MHTLLIVEMCDKLQVVCTLCTVSVLFNVFPTNLYDILHCIFIIQGEYIILHITNNKSTLNYILQATVNYADISDFVQKHHLYVTYH